MDNTHHILFSKIHSPVSDTMTLSLLSRGLFSYQKLPYTYFNSSKPKHIHSILFILALLLLFLLFLFFLFVLLFLFLFAIYFIIVTILPLF